MSKGMLTAERLRSLLAYDPETGWFTVIAPRKKARLGDIVGGPDNKTSDDGYIRFWVDNVLYLAHRLAWLHVHGEWPEDQLDHVNRDRRDNRVTNLRQATNAQNQQNITKSGRKGASGAVGVHFRKRAGANAWFAHICINGKKKHLGCFSDREQAMTAYAKEKMALHTFAGAN